VLFRWAALTTLKSKPTGHDANGAQLQLLRRIPIPASSQSGATAEKAVQAMAAARLTGLSRILADFCNALERPAG
jgi:hypothetical protein